MTLSALLVGLTVLAYLAATHLHMVARRHPVANVVLITALLVLPVLYLGKVSTSSYAEATRPLGFLLGPATVALALPLFRSLGELRAATRPVIVALVSAVVVATVSALAVGRLLGLSRETLLSVAPKTVTTPIAMAVAARLGGSPALATIAVMITGIFGALVVPTLFDLARVRDPRARGVALGVAAHGVGTARALQLGGVEAAFSALGMGLSGVLTPFVAPLVVDLVLRLPV